MPQGWMPAKEKSLLALNQSNANLSFWSAPSIALPEFDDPLPQPFSRIGKEVHHASNTDDFVEC